MKGFIYIFVFQKAFKWNIFLNGDHKLQDCTMFLFMTMWFLVSKINLLNAKKTNFTKIISSLASSFTKLLSSFPQTAQQFCQTAQQFPPNCSAVWPNCSAVSPKLLSSLVSSFTKLLSSLAKLLSSLAKSSAVSPKLLSSLVKLLTFCPNCSAVWWNCWPNCWAVWGNCWAVFVKSLFFFAWFCINSSPFFCLFSFLVLDFSLRALVFSKLFLVFCESLAWFVCFGQHRGHACEAKKRG